MCKGEPMVATHAAHPMLDAESFAQKLQVAVRKTVYFVRHGKAKHNVLEEQVKRTASAEAEALGHSKGSEEFDAHLKDARLKALSDETFRDAELCDDGKAQVAGARALIVNVARGAVGLPQPTAVLVSPLFRTLQTAAALFPEHPNVRVCDLLRERRTGLPCDEVSFRSRSSSEFSHIDFDDPSDTLSERPSSVQSSVSGRSLASLGASTSEFSDAGDAVEVEDPASLRLRTAGFAQLLRCLEDSALCVVSHKAWLRELERGPLGRPQAAEFSPGEVRAFDVTVYADGSMDASPRYEGRGGRESLPPH